MGKFCSKCNLVKEGTFFSKNISSKDGLSCLCKSCVKEYQDKNKEKIKLKQKEYNSSEIRKKKREENKEKIKIRNRKYYEKNRDHCLTTSRTYHANNKDKRDEYRTINKDKIKKYRETNSSIRALQSKQYRARNEEAVKEYEKKYSIIRKEKRKLRSKNDPLFKLKLNLRTRTSAAFRSKGYTKRSKSFDILGADCNFIKKYIEDKFTEGMSWDNYGAWHIDHIIPLCIAKTQDELYSLCHYSNLQPLWKIDNLTKSKKYIKNVSTVH